MKTLLKYSPLFLLLLILSACTVITPPKGEDESIEDDELIRILDDRFPLMKAVEGGKTDEIKRLLKIEAFKKNVDQQDEEGNTALLFAAEYGFEDILNLLIEAGADPNLSDFKKRTPLMNASYKGKANIVTRLLKMESVKKNINTQDIKGNTAFLFAAKKGYDNIMDLLLGEGADSTLSNFKERTPLMEASYRGQLDSVTRLLKMESVKKNINTQDIKGDTAFMFAAKKGYDNIMDLLLGEGADSTLSNFKERTPLMEAAYRGQLNSVTKLLKIKAVRDNINAEDKEGNRALSLANQEGYKQVASLLQEAGATPQPIKETYLNIKRAFKRMFVRQDRENPLRKAAAQSDKEAHPEPQSLFERISSFFKNLF